MDALLIATAGLLLLILALVRWRREQHVPQGSPGGPIIPAGVTLSPQPLLTEADASVYNLLRLAVQDQYLVFAQVPVWCLAEVKAPDRPARLAFLNKIALRRVDFVLVHPGTLAVVKVIELDEASPASPEREERDHLIEAVLRTAGIELVRLNVREPYTVPALAARLGLAPEDEL